MRPTPAWLLDRRELGLRSLVDADLTRPIRWVHVSELADPAPFLSGGEFLLTVGLAGDWTAYARRLAAHGLAGLGFGVGFGHDEVPRELLDAARERGLPVLEVPRTTPFIAISEAVAAAISGAHERADAIDAQRGLIAAALDGPRAVLDGLARALGCWCLILDERGAARHSSPAGARKHAERLAHDLARLGSPVRAASLDLGADQVALLPIAPDGGFLAAGRATPLGAADHAVLTSAAGLLSLDLAAQREVAGARRNARRAVLRLATGEHTELTRAVADTLEVPLPAAPVRVAVLGTDADSADVLRAVEEHQALSQVNALVVRHEQHTVVVVLPVAEGDLQALEEVLHRVPGSRGVVTEGVGFGELPDALRRARSVFFGTPKGERLIPAKDVATAGLLAQLDTPGALGWADALLEPLERHATRSKLDLVSTLRVFLGHNGHIDASAAALGIHRHTLRYRLGRIVELLGSDLDDPTARAELWLALRLREADR
ncbi:PucR family transcriptional regulator [Amycolatopsis acidiphila]|uniref:PucR family transcriptional regulator n=1 Tax=Amycolatopsis acidiphila TaxID=715473 RepID=A0A558A4J9_9PSEU|nr:PucR family transcriptional regulator [Amycolatopsis acidiphila]TVT19183.1 PucR family transcriptional regulator [Amycolatopsis acidiphila]UIJ61998.1 PucR family transcriptional regulator [Amycolatopsis acidiphila]GHG56701.1 PucR family transcriptional regulator [Amycolatopsis acidiphila]